MPEGWTRGLVSYRTPVDRKAVCSRREYPIGSPSIELGRLNNTASEEIQHAHNITIGQTLHLLSEFKTTKISCIQHS